MCAGKRHVWPPLPQKCCLILSLWRWAALHNGVWWYTDGGSRHFSIDRRVFFLPRATDRPLTVCICMAVNSEMPCALLLAGRGRLSPQVILSLTVAACLSCSCPLLHAWWPSARLHWWQTAVSILQYVCTPFLCLIKALLKWKLKLLSN